ncbi:MAG TPA: LacI family transcriptional regulator [Clostridiales bacterium]|nr:LacI family transcriptional regulator [Clostridiales bacterium]
MARKKLPTMWDVARLAGVTQATVSHVINGTASISQEVKKRVSEAIDELGYVPNAAARSLKQNKTYTIGLIVPDVHSGFYSQMAKAVEESAREHGYITFLCNTSYHPQLEDYYINNLIQQQVAGIILGYGLVDQKVCNKVLNARIPLLMLDSSLKIGDWQVPSVEVDNLKGSWLAVEYLYNMGIKEIGYISEPLYNNTLKLRYEGYVKAMENLGCTINKDFIDIHAKEYDKIKMGYESVDKILAQGKPRAIFVSADQLAFGAIKRLTELKIKIPEDIAIVGYDDIPLSTVVTPRLTTIFQPIDQMGKMGFEMLKKLIDGTKIPNKKVVLDPKLVVRESA